MGAGGVGVCVVDVYAHVSAYMWRPEVKYLPQLLCTLFFETGSVPGVSNFTRFPGA